MENDSVAISRSWESTTAATWRSLWVSTPPYDDRGGGRWTVGHERVPFGRRTTPVGCPRPNQTPGHDSNETRPSGLLQSHGSGADRRAFARGAPEQPTCPGNDTLPGSIGVRVGMLREHLRHHGSPQGRSACESRNPGAPRQATVLLSVWKMTRCDSSSRQFGPLTASTPPPGRDGHRDRRARQVSVRVQTGRGPERQADASTGRSRWPGTASRRRSGFSVMSPTQRVFARSAEEVPTQQVTGKLRRGLVLLGQSPGGV